MVKCSSSREHFEGGPRPSWKRLVTAPLRALPSIVVAGTNRGGTTSLFHYLAQHPQVVTGIRKEVHFFDSDVNWAKGAGWYRAHFPRRADLRRRERGDGRPRHALDATPGYMFFEECPARMARVVPRARLVISLRPPVERAHSSYRKSLSQGRATASFEEQVEHELAAEAGEVGPLGAQPPGTLLARGRYAEQLERVFAAFPAGQVLVLESADLFRDAVAASSAVFGFLGLEPFQVEPQVKNAAPMAQPVSDRLRARLEEYFAPHDARLEELLGRRVGWRRGDPTPARP